MGVHREAPVLPGDVIQQRERPGRAAQHPVWTQAVLAGVRAHGAAALGAVLVSAGCLDSVLRQPAYAQSRPGLGWLGGFDHPRGSRTEFSGPAGYACRYEQGSRPSLNIGAGVVEPMILPGIYGYTSEPIAAREGSPAPVAGAFLHIPLGSDKGTDCKRIIAIETAMLRLQNAKQMFIDGLITKEQLAVVIERSYAVIAADD